MAGERSAELIRLVSAFERSEKTKDVVRESIEFLRGSDGAHYDKLCSAMLKAINGGGQEYAELLHCRGPLQALVVTHTNLPRVSTPVARWLANEVLKLLTSAHFISDLFAQCSNNPSSCLTPVQDHLVGVVCRFPDVLANRIGRNLPASLLPAPYFKYIGLSLYQCLVQVYSSIKGSHNCSLVFPAVLLGKAALLGHKNSLMSELLSRLETRVVSDQLWSRISQTLFSHVPTSSLEQILEALVSATSPSLSSNPPLHLLIGDLVLKNNKAKFVLSHKLILTRVPSSPYVAQTLVGYLSSTEHARQLLVNSLQSALEVWSDGSALRHMDLRQHLWISRVIVLSFTCLKEREVQPLKTKLQRLVMLGVQIHLESPISQQRHIGMAVGECVFNKLHSQDEEHRLKFEYETTDEIRELQQLARPISEQEVELKAWREGRGSSSDNDEERGEDLSTSQTEADREVKGEERYGEGLVEARECSDSDSDDGLVSYSMADDPDSSLPPPPRYLRTLMKVLISSESPLELDGALRVSTDMIRSQPSDLKEVCVELAKIFLHLSDNFSLDEFVSLRLSAMVSLTVCCPDLVTPYFTKQFYAPNYSLRQRLDILEVLASASLELAQPIEDNASAKKQSKGAKKSEGGDLDSASSSMLNQQLVRKPWEEIIVERLKAKTRLISKGPSKSPPKPVANRFVSVAPLFFFPLMSRFDQPVNTLDLLGQDSLVLGNLLYTLGTVMYAATNIPLVVSMATTLLEFLWALRYHQNAYVRQGVLFSLSMLIAATPPHSLLVDMEAGLSEAVLWVRQQCDNEPDAQCRSLAQHTMTILSAAMKPLK